MSFNDELSQRVYQRFSGNVAAEEIYLFVKEVAFDSWKNSLAAGRNRNTPPKKGVRGELGDRS